MVTEADIKTFLMFYVCCCKLYGFKTKIMKETKKQLDYIRFIEEETGIEYKGNTKAEASEYISENKDKIPYSSTINMWALVNGY